MNKKKEGLKNENQLSIFDSSIAEETKNDNEEYITLFPSSWFYNASVIGFLIVLSDKYNKEIEDNENGWLKNDGTVRIPKSVLLKTEFVDKEDKQELLEILKLYVEYEVSDEKSNTWLKNGKKDEAKLLNLFLKEFNKLDTYKNELKKDEKILEEYITKKKIKPDFKKWKKENKSKVINDFIVNYIDIDNYDEYIENNIKQLKKFIENKQLSKELIIWNEKRDIISINKFIDEINKKEEYNNYLKEKDDDILDNSIDFLKEIEEYKNWDEVRNLITNDIRYEKYSEKFKNKYFSYKYIQIGDKIFSTFGNYPNLIQSQNWKDFLFSNYLKKRLSKYGDKDKNKLCCGMCGDVEAITEEDYSDNTMELGLSSFKEGHSKLLGGSIGGFPNSFWNNKMSFLVCPLCNLFIIFNHIVFSKSSHFINTNSFKTSWYINKYFSVQESDLKNSLSISLINFSKKIQANLGLWNMLNIEIIENNSLAIKTYSIPERVSKIILNKSISNLLLKINNKKIMNLIFDGNFKELLLDYEEILVNFIKNKGTDKEKKYFEEKKYVKYLPELYIRISNLLSKEGL